MAAHSAQGGGLDVTANSEVLKVCLRPGQVYMAAHTTQGGGLDITAKQKAAAWTLQQISSPKSVRAAAAGVHGGALSGGRRAGRPGGAAGRAPGAGGPPWVAQLGALPGGEAQPTQMPPSAP